VIEKLGLEHLAQNTHASTTHDRAAGGRDSLGPKGRAVWGVNPFPSNSDLRSEFAQLSG